MATPEASAPPLAGAHGSVIFSQIRSNPLKSAQIRSNPLKSAQIRSNPLKSAQIRSLTMPGSLESANCKRFSPVLAVAPHPCNCPFLFSLSPLLPFCFGWSIGMIVLRPVGQAHLAYQRAVSARHAAHDVNVAAHRGGADK